MGRRGRYSLIDEHFFFVITTVVKFTPIFNEHQFCDILILNIKHYQKMYWTKLKYIHNNPVKAGLVLKEKDYKYLSARNYINNDHSVLEIDKELGGVYSY
ncbi:MAG: hypothetical protein IH949_09955 [Bacteroidetes bacterium]|nr:hypothetical protein [Bacteroidota bacterium]